MIQKKIMAKTALEALKKESKIPVHEVFISSDWEKNNIEKEDAIGFCMPTNKDDEDTTY